MTDVERNFARCFTSPSGQAVIQYLRKITIERVLGADATDAQLRGIEAQRALVHHIETLSRRGNET